MGSSKNLEKDLEDRCKGTRGEKFGTPSQGWPAASNASRSGLPSVKRFTYDINAISDHGEVQRACVDDDDDAFVASVMINTPFG